MLAKQGLWLISAVATALVALGIGLLARWQAGVREQVSARWQQQLAQRNEAEAAALVRLVRQHDTLAIGPLAQALSDPRPQVAAAARESVGNLVADWRQLPPGEAVPRLTELAKMLADNYVAFSPADQRFIRQLAQTLLVWPLEDADFLADDLVAQCERILVAPLPVLPELTEPVEPADQSLPPIVSPQIAARPLAAPAAEPIEPPEQEPAPITRPPNLVSPPTDDPPPMPQLDEPAAQEPRQFIRPRVPPIPPAVEP